MILCIIASSFCYYLPAYSQTCTGVLRAPFSRTNFGVTLVNYKPAIGSANPFVVGQSFYGAYATQPATGPATGFYTSSNTTAGKNFPDFVDRFDHTTGTYSGAMLVFNLNGTVGKFYDQTIYNLCGGTTAQVSMWVMNVNPDLTLDKPNIRIDILNASNDQLLNSITSGPIDYDADAATAWKKLAVIFQVPVNITSVKFQVYNLVASTNGNDLAIDDIDAAICAPGSTIAQVPSSACKNETGTIQVTIPAGSYANYFFKLQKRTLGVATWTDDGSIVDNGANNVYTATINNSQGGYEYRVVAAGSAAGITSPKCNIITDSLEYKVIDFSTSLTGPLQICYNSSAVLASAIIPGSGSGTPSTGYTYQWETSTDGSTGWSVITGETAATLTTMALTASRYYRVTATANGCARLSNIFQVNVNPEKQVTLSTVGNICATASEFLLPYQLVQGNPDKYSLTATDLAGFINISNTGFAGTPLHITLPASLIAGTYHFNFTAINSVDGCQSQPYPFTVTVDALPSAANAGTAQTFCTASSIALNAATPAIGAGVWTQATGPSASVIASPGTAATSASNIQPGTYVYRWTVSNGACPATDATVNIDVMQPPAAAQAGNDSVQYNSGVFIMAANTPGTASTGTWSVINGSAVITDINAPSTSVTLGRNSSATLRWTLSKGSCPSQTDDVVLTYTSISDIRISKTMATAGPYVSGQDIAYHIEITNTGPSNAGSVRITDVYPPQFIAGTASITTLNGSQLLQNNSSSSGLDIVAMIPAGVAKLVVDIPGKINPAYDGSFSNTTTGVSENETDTDGAVASATITTSRKPYLTLTQTGPSAASAGTAITYTITVKNIGSSDALNAILTDTLPAAIINAGWSAAITSNAGIISGATGTGNLINIAANIPAGETGTVVITINGTIAASAAGTIMNKALLTPSETASGVFTSNWVSTNIAGSPGLSLSKQGSAAAAGEMISYDIVLKNNGPGNAIAAVIKDTIPPMIQNVTWSAIAQGGASISGPAGGNGNIITVTGNIPAGDINTISIHAIGMIDAGFTGDILNRAFAFPSETGAHVVKAEELRTIAKRVNLGIQTNAPPVAFAGQRTSFTIDITNNGPSHTTGTMISDLVPVLLSDVSWETLVLQGTGQITSGATGTGNNVQATANINAGATIRLIVSGTVLPDVSGVFSNKATATPAEPGSSAVSATSNTQINQQARLMISTSGPDIAGAGDAIIYTIEATNNGPSNANAAVISDIIPAGIQNINWTTSVTGQAHIIDGAAGTGNNLRIAADIAAGSGNKVLVTVQGKIASSYSGVINNKALITASEPSSKNDSVTKTTTVSRVPILTVTNAATNSVVAGDSITYYIEINNTGTADALNTAINSTLPAELTGVQWKTGTAGGSTIAGATTGTGNTISLMASLPGETGNKILLTITAKVSPDFSGVINTTVTVTPSENTTAISASHAVTVDKLPKLRIQKIGPSEMHSGERMLYKVITSNFGRSNALNLEIIDTVPATIENTTWEVFTYGRAVVTSALSGTGNIIRVTGDIPQDDTNRIVINVSGRVNNAFSGIVKNIASVRMLQPVSETIYADPVITTVIRKPSLAIDKAASDTINAGETMTWVLTASNTGLSYASAAIITDSISSILENPQWSSIVSDGAQVLSGSNGTGNFLNMTADIPPAGKIVITITGRVPNNTNQDSITNIAKIQPSEPGAAAVYSSRKITKITRKPAIRITKTGPARLYAGDRIIYAIRVNNAGPSIANGVTITDTIPASLHDVSWTAGTTGNSIISSGSSGTGNLLKVVASILPGDEHEITISVTALSDPYYQGDIVNRAIASPSETGITPVVSLPVVTTVSRYAKLEIVKSGPVYVTPGSTVSYGLSIYNDGPSTAKNISIKDLVSPLLLNPSWQATAGDSSIISSGASGNVQHAVISGDLSRTGIPKISVAIKGTADPAYTGTSVGNTAYVYNDATVTAAAPGVDSSTVSSIVQRYTNLRIFQSGPANAAAGQAVQYILNVENLGPSDVYRAAIKDLLPADITNISWTATNLNNVTNIIPASGTGNVDLVADMAASKSKLQVVINGTMALSATDGTVVTNNATVALPLTSTAIDPSLTDNSNSITTIIDNDPALRIAKSGPAKADIGDTIVYKLVVTNGSAGTISNIQISDVVPPGITVSNWAASATGSAIVTGTATGSSNTISTTGDIPAGAGNSITVAITGIVNNTAGTTLSNTASATSGTTKASTVITTVNNSTDIAVVTSGPKKLIAGQEGSYTIEILNYGPADADSIAVSDIIPAEFINPSWYAVTTGNASIQGTTRMDGAGNTILVTGKLAAGIANNITIYVTSKLSGQTTTPAITNTAQVNVLSPADFNSSNNTNSLQTDIVRDINLRLRKTGAPKAHSGDLVAYELVISNAGPSDAQNIAITDVVPPQIINTKWELAVTGNASANGAFGGTGNTVQTNVNLPAGNTSHIVVTVTGKIKEDYTGNIQNIVTATGGIPLITVRDTANTVVTPKSELTVHKTGPVSVTAGAGITYMITAENFGPSAAKNVRITDTLDARIQNIRWTATAANGAVILGSASDTGRFVIVNADIPAAGTGRIAIVISGRLRADATGQLKNTANIFSPDTATESVTTPAVITNINRKPVLSVSKIGVPAVYAGDSLRYILLVENIGLSDAKDATITDILPAQMRNPTWYVERVYEGDIKIKSGQSGTGYNLQTVADIPAGAFMAIRVFGKVDSSYTGSMHNTAIAVPSETTFGIGDTGTVYTNVSLLPILEISKSGPSTPIAGQPVSYTITVKNTGPSLAKNALIKDILDARIRNAKWETTVYGNATVKQGGSGSGNQLTVIADIPPGVNDAVIITITGTLDGSLRDSIINTASVTAAETNQAVTAGTKAIILTRPNIRIQKTGPQVIAAGQHVTYYINISNDGPTDALKLRITDTIPAMMQNVTWSSNIAGVARLQTAQNGTGNIIDLLADLPVGTDNKITITVTGTIPLTASGNMSGTAYAIPAEQGAEQRSSTLSTRVVPPGSDNILLISKTGPSFMTRGQKASYVITVNNYGYLKAGGVIISDTVSTVLADVSWAATSLRTATITSGSTGTGNRILVQADMPEDTSGVQIVVTGTVLQAAPLTTIVNTAYAKLDTITVVSPKVTSQVEAVADIEVIKSGPAIAYSGNQLVYQVTVTNRGPSDAHGTTIVDSIPAGLTLVSMQPAATTNGASGISINNLNGNPGALIGNFPASASVTFYVTVLVGSTPMTVNTKVSAGLPPAISDRNMANNSSSVQTILAQKVPLDVVKLVTPATPPYRPGNTVMFTIRATNKGVSDINPVTVTDTLPAATLLSNPVVISTTKGNTSFNATTGILQWVAGLLKPGETAEMVYTMQVTGRGIATNTVKADGPPDVAIPDTAMAKLNVGWFANLKVSKSLITRPPLTVGKVLEFTINVTNNGPDTASNIYISDLLLPELSAPAWMSDRGIFDPSTRTIRWQIPSLLPNRSQTVAFSCVLLNGKFVNNKAEVRGDEIDLDMIDNSFTITPVPVTGDDILIPNAVTPNGDGKNDKFAIQGIANHPNSILTIYNRWGNEVFHSNNYDNSWDGKGLSQGTYYYTFMRKEASGGYTEFKGWVLLQK